MRRTLLFGIFAELILKIQSAKIDTTDSGTCRISRNICGCNTFTHSILHACDAALENVERAISQKKATKLYTVVCKDKK
jgi:hypothetical protein